MNKNQQLITTIVLIIAGIILLYMGYQSSGSVESRLSSAFTGSSSNKTLAFYIGGAACVIAGLIMQFKKR